MNNNIAIEFENVGKQYRLGRVGTGTLAHDLNRWWQTSILGHEDPYLKIGETNDRSTRGNSDYVWALQDISFKVEQGDVVGIIGKNGAGKSTLLKLLSHITAPTTGRISYRGRIASLLEVGTGFHPEMTARENIYMNGSIMGMRRHEINAKLDEIVDFAGIERYLDTPVKRFSSGMYVRLGFAVAAFLEPEILVVDEVLAVGDAEFQKKAIGKMQDVSKGQGRTVLFVSHNMAAVRSLCHRGIVLENGLLIKDDISSEAIDFYLKNAAQSNNKRIIDAVTIKQSFISINEIRINGTTSTHSTINYDQESIEVEIAGCSKEAFTCDVKIIFRNTANVPVAIYMEGRYKNRIEHFSEGEFFIRRTIRIPKYFAKGDLSVDVTLYQPLVRDYFTAENCATIYSVGKYDSFSRPIILNTEGVIGLESYE